MSKKLLLADDSITIQKVIQITFAHEDYELTITDNGDSAMSKALEIKPDLVMADVYMPGKNGYELASAIKQNPSLQHIPVLLLAGSFEPFDEDKARGCKADAWIEKPFESQMLIDKVAELLSAAAPATQAAAPEVEPAVEPVAFEDAPLAAFEEHFDAEPQMTASMEADPFGDISFAEEEPAEAPVFTEDWSDVSLEPEEEPVAVEPLADTEEPALAVEENFTFTEEPSVSAEAYATVEGEPVKEADFDTFDMGEEEIVPLGDDDILGAEDLEPLVEEQTLAAWSRAESDGEDIFSAPLEEEPATEQAVLVEPEMPDFVEEEQAFVEESQVFEEPTAEDLTAEEPVAASVAAESAETAMAEVEEKASAMSEAEIEQIVEKVVTKIVEKLAESILEKVAWEVVPDMAENLIRQEIRKIKDAAA
jgi:CheY-like chemotaxis protein